MARMPSSLIDTLFATCLDSGELASCSKSFLSAELLPFVIGGKTFWWVNEDERCLASPADTCN